jgi:carboxylesterase
MTQYAHLDPGPFFLPGGPVGAVLFHGFTGSPPEMRRVGDYLHARGVTVHAPLLPGHGTSSADLATRSWREWLAAAEAALARVKAHCDTVFVCGFSLGSLLAICLAARHPELAGAILYSPALRVRDWRIYLTPFLKYVVPPLHKGGASDLDDPAACEFLWSYDRDVPSAAAELYGLIRRARKLLPAVGCPLLVVYSTRDATIHRQAGPYALAHAGSADKQSLVLHRSGHCLTVDREWEQVAAHTYEFITAHAELSGKPASEVSPLP